MADVELMGYKIKKIDMNNNLSDSGLLQLENSIDFYIDYAENNRSAEATLFGYLRYNKNPDIFFLKLDVQAIFRVYGIENSDEKYEASLKCYDALFLCFREIMTCLAENTGLDDFNLEKPEIFKQPADSEKNKLNDKGSEKIIEFTPDIDI